MPETSLFASTGRGSSGCWRENAKSFMRQNPDIAAKIEAAIRQNAGLIAEKILAGEEGATAADDEAAEG